MLLLSVRLSVTYIANDAITQRLSVPTFGRCLTLDANRIPVSRSNGQRSGLEAVEGIPCRPNPAATLLVVIIYHETAQDLRSPRMTSPLASSKVFPCSSVIEAAILSCNNITGGLSTGQLNCCLPRMEEKRRQNITYQINTRQCDH